MPNFETQTKLVRGVEKKKKFIRGWLSPIWTALSRQSNRYFVWRVNWIVESSKLDFCNPRKKTCVTTKTKSMQSVRTSKVHVTIHTTRIQIKDCTHRHVHASWSTLYTSGVNREMLDSPSPRRSDASKKRRAVGSAAPRRKLTAWPPASLLPNPSPMSPTELSRERARRARWPIDYWQEHTSICICMSPGPALIPSHFYKRELVFKEAIKNLRSGGSQ